MFCSSYCWSVDALFPPAIIRLGEHANQTLSWYIISGSNLLCIGHNWISAFITHNSSINGSGLKMCCVYSSIGRSGKYTHPRGPYLHWSAISRSIIIILAWHDKEAQQFVPTTEHNTAASSSWMEWRPEHCLLWKPIKKWLSGLI